MRLLRSLVPLLVVVRVHALDVLDPEGLPQHVTTLIYNRYLGTQDVPHLVDVPITVWRGREAPAFDASCVAAHANSIVLIDQQEAVWVYLDELKLGLTMQQCGVKAIVRLKYHEDRARSLLGFSYHNSDHNCCKSEGWRIRVPYLVVWHKDPQELMARVEGGEEVRGNITRLDTNHWVEMYDSAAFFTIFRVLFPTANFLIVLYALVVLFRQRSSSATTGSARGRLMPFIYVALALEISGCTLRGVYCAMGPFFSNGAFTRQENMLLANLSLPLQMPVLLTLAVFLRKIIKIKRLHNPPRRAVVAVFALFCLLVLGLELWGGYVRGTSDGEQFAALLLFTAGLSVVVLLGSGAVFLVAGLRFLHRMRGAERMAKKHVSRNSNRVNVQSLRVAFTNNILFSTLGVVLELVGIALALTSLLYQPYGLLACISVYYGGFTIAAFFHTRSLTPFSRVNQARRRPKHRRLRRRGEENQMTRPENEDPNSSLSRAVGVSAVQAAEGEGRGEGEEQEEQDEWSDDFDDDEFDDGEEEGEAEGQLREEDDDGELEIEAGGARSGGDEPPEKATGTSRLEALLSRKAKLQRMLAVRLSVARFLSPFSSGNGRMQSLPPKNPPEILFDKQGMPRMNSAPGAVSSPKPERKEIDAASATNQDGHDAEAGDEREL